MRRLPGLTFWLAISVSVQAQDWPSFRGPNAAGVNDAKPLRTSWNAAAAQNFK